VRSDQTDNTLAAHIGQLEDRFDRRSAGTAVASSPPAGMPPPV
jgi:hypothetical protein